MSRVRYSVSDVEEMLQGGAFRPSDDLKIQVRTTLRKPLPALPFTRYAWMVGLTVLIAALVLTGIVVALSRKEKAARIDYGIKAVYETGLVHTIDETRQVGDISLTVDWVYADWNQILVGYSIHSPVDPNDQVEVQIVSAALSDGTVLKGGPKTGYDEMNIVSIVAAYEAPENLRSLEATGLQLVFRVEHFRYRTPSQIPEADMSEAQPTRQAEPMPVESMTTGGEETVIELSIPVTSGRIIEVAQTVEANGYAVTLEQVVLAPSMTIARLCFDVPDPVRFHHWYAFVTLTAGSKGYSGAGDDYQVGESYSCQRVEIQESVPLDHERYVFRVNELVGFEFHSGEIVTTDMLPEEQWRIKGPWVFTLDKKP